MINHLFREEEENNLPQMAKFDAHSRATQGVFSETYEKKNDSDG